MKAQEMTLPNISILSLGGTIAMKSDNSGGGVVPKLTAEDLVSVVPELSSYANIQAQTFRTIPGAHLSWSDLEALAKEIEGLEKSGTQGVVVTQGTDTIEETSFVLDSILTTDIPVVVTGAMRNPTRPGADGPANLLGAVQVAASSQAKGLGALVVFNDDIHAAKFVTKAHTSNVATFSSAPLGPVGFVSEDQVRVHLKPQKGTRIEVSRQPRDVRVPIFKVSLCEDATLVKAAVSAGVDGIVVEALGGGHVSPEIADALQIAAEQIPVILTSRTGQGESLTQTYAFTGSEMDLLSRGILSGGRLNGTQARVILALLLRHGNGSRSQITSHLRTFTSP